MKKTLWTRNYTLLTIATVLGGAGGIAGGFALSFLVFDETGSTLASALILAIRLIPGFVIPLVAAPWMDRMKRKPVLVTGDAVNGVLYMLAGIYLLRRPFTYAGYLGFSLLLSSLEAFDSLAYMSIYPGLIEPGMEQKGYAVSAMLYPVMQVIMTPFAALLLDTLGVARILLMQGALSMLAALVESRICIQEESRMGGEGFSIKIWVRDIREAAAYLGDEPGLAAVYGYMAVTNGVAAGYGPLLVAFFRVTAGFTTAMYSLFSLAEFAGRSLGGVVQYRMELPKEKRFSFAFFVYQVYEAMDMCLLWLPYPAMLINRAVCGFLGINSATIRQAAVQRYIPEHLRARLNAFSGMLTLLFSSLLTLGMGLLGEMVDYRIAMTIGGAGTMLACLLLIWRGRRHVRRIYEY